MENKDVVLSTINETKGEISNFKQALEAKSKELPNIPQIKDQLTLIGKVVREIKTLCDNEGKNLQTIFENLTYTQIKELLDKTELMFDVISENLPNGMEVKKAYSDAEEELDMKRDIYYENELVGEILICDDSDEKLKIKVQINKNEKDFEVEKPYRMYHIISYINTTFNYE